MCQGGEKGCQNPAEYGWKLCEVCLVKAADELDALYGDMDKERERNNRQAIADRIEEIRPFGRPDMPYADLERMARKQLEEESEQFRV